MILRMPPATMWSVHEFRDKATKVSHLVVSLSKRTKVRVALCGARVDSAHAWHRPPGAMSDPCARCASSFVALQELLRP